MIRMIPTIRSSQILSSRAMPTGRSDFASSARHRASCRTPHFDFCSDRSCVLSSRDPACFPARSRSAKLHAPVML
jgi:hypothetical protein